MDEFVSCLRRVLADEVVEFHGEFYDIPASTVAPGPVQRPSPPFLIGGYGPAAVRRAAALGDGFIGGNLPLDAVRPLIDDLGAAFESQERDPAEAKLVCRGAVQVYGEAQGPDRRPLFGTMDEIRTDIERYRDAGLDQLFLELNFDPSVGVLDADPEASMSYALDLMETLAPGR